MNQIEPGNLHEDHGYDNEEKPTEVELLYLADFLLLAVQDQRGVEAYAEHMPHLN